MHAKVGDLIKILGFEPDSDGKIYAYEAKFIGKTGRVTSIGGMGELYGTWGKINIRPEDEIEVIEEPKTLEDVMKREG
jgi:hypothetical protein